MTRLAQSLGHLPAAWTWLLLPVLLAVALYAQLVPALVQEWTEFPSLSHGFAVPLIAVYLLWTRRERILAAPWAPSFTGLPVLVLGVAVFTIGTRGDEVFLARLSLPVTLFGISLFVAGWQFTKAVWLGIAYLVFMIPMPYSTLKLLTQRSRLIDADASAALLQLFGVPVYQDGVMLHLPNIALEVADDCSSIPAIAALLSLGAVYASLSRSPLAVRTALVLSTVPLAIAANIIRITLTAAAAYYIGPWTLGGFYHKFSGTMTFLLTFFLLTLLDQALTTAARWWKRT
jgi:exosortase